MENVTHGDSIDLAKIIGICFIIGIGSSIYLWLLLLFIYGIYSNSMGCIIFVIISSIMTGFALSGAGPGGSGG